MKIGTTATILGVDVKAVAGQEGCYGCDLNTRDRDDLTISKRRKLQALCNQMPRNCVDLPVVYKIEGMVI